VPNGRAALFGLVCGLVACSAHIKEFAVTPGHICAGQKVTLRWSVVGAAHLTATPALAGPFDENVPSDGRTTIAPTQSTRVVLRVTRVFGAPTEAKQDIEVRSGAETPEVLTASLGDPAVGAACKDDKISATVHVKRFTENMKVDRVVLHEGDKRSYEVRHDGHTGAVTAGAVETAFRGTAIAGDWMLVSPLLAGEACGTPTLPRNLIVDVYTECRAEGTP
jgi:hypothetical protein